MPLRHATHSHCGANRPCWAPLPAITSLTYQKARTRAHPPTKTMTEPCECCSLWFKSSEAISDSSTIFHRDFLSHVGFRVQHCKSHTANNPTCVSKWFGWFGSQYNQQFVFVTLGVRSNIPKLFNTTELFCCHGGKVSAASPFVLTPATGSVTTSSITMQSELQEPLAHAYHLRFHVTECLWLAPFTPQG